MKALAVVFVLGAAVTVAQGQYKAPSQYFRKDFPTTNPSGQQPQPQAPQQPQARQSGATNKAPVQPALPRFKNVGTNAQFYFLSDTNRAYPWVKISSSVATNTKTGARQSLHPEIPVQQ
jgi:hypothetical protein